jgi:hypothetical protein
MPVSRARTLLPHAAGCLTAARILIGGAAVAFVVAAVETRSRAI